MAFWAPMGFFWVLGWGLKDVLGSTYLDHQLLFSKNGSIWALIYIYECFDTFFNVFEIFLKTDRLTKRQDQPIKVTTRDLKIEGNIENKCCCATELNLNSTSTKLQFNIISTSASNLTSIHSQPNLMKNMSLNLNQNIHTMKMENRQVILWCMSVLGERKPKQFPAFRQKQILHGKYRSRS